MKLAGTLPEMGFPYVKGVDKHFAVSVLATKPGVCVHQHFGLLIPAFSAEQAEEQGIGIGVRYWGDGWTVEATSTEVLIDGNHS